jgi:hypothetical protein
MRYELGNAMYHEPRRESWFGSLVRACMCLAVLSVVPVVLVVLLALAWWMINLAAPYIG